MHAHFQREEPADEVEVVARCVAGVPQFQVSQEDRPYEDHGERP